MQTTLALLVIAIQSATATWSSILTQHAPSARTSAAMARTEAGVLLFGGTNGEHSSNFKSDTWLFDGKDWILQETATAPGPRAIGQMASIGKGAVMFGGLSGLGNFLALNDTWTWTAEEGWRELSLPVAPPARAYHQMQTTEFGVVLFGGRTFHLDVWEESFNDVWLFDGAGWSEVSLDAVAPRPSARYAMALAPVEQGLLLFGGAGSSEDDHLGDTWLLHINGTGMGDFRWQELQNYPAPRGRWCMNAASCGSGVLIAGGSIDYRVSSNETWQWKPNVLESVWGPEHDSLGEWERVDTAPVANSGYASSGYDMDGQSGMLVFGGNFAPSDDPTQMAFSNATTFWSCS